MASSKKYLHFILEQLSGSEDVSPIHIENDRLLICSLKTQDLKALQALRDDRQVYCYEPTFLAELQGTPEGALEAIRNMDLYEDRQCILGIYELTDPSVLVGLVELYDFKPSGKVISIGYRLLSEHWGKGIASSCINAMLFYIRDNTNVELVTAHVIPENKASARCLIKNGFEYLLTKEEDWGYGRLCIADVYSFDC